MEKFYLIKEKDIRSINCESFPYGYNNYEITSRSLTAIDPSKVEYFLEKTNKDDFIDAIAWAMENIEKYSKNPEKERENIMEILDLYVNNQINNIQIITDEKINQTLKEDKIFKIIEEANLKIKELLGEEEDIKYITTMRKEIIEEKTKNEIKKIKQEASDMKENVYNLQDEVDKMLAIAETYEQKIGILKAYNIVDEKGVLVKPQNIVETFKNLKNMTNKITNLVVDNGLKKPEHDYSEERTENFKKVKKVKKVNNVEAEEN